MYVGIHTELIEFRKDEGRSNFYERSQRLQDALEQLSEMGTVEERAHVVPLLEAVNRAILEVAREKGT